MGHSYLHRRQPVYWKWIKRDSVIYELVFFSISLLNALNYTYLITPFLFVRATGCTPSSPSRVSKMLTRSRINHHPSLWRLGRPLIQSYLTFLAAWRDTFSCTVSSRRPSRGQPLCGWRTSLALLPAASTMAAERIVEEFLPRTIYNNSEIDRILFYS